MSKPKDEAVSGAILKLAGIIFGLPLMVVSRGWVFAVLWGWFITPALHVPRISIPVAMGMSLICNLLTRDTSSKTEELPFGYSLAGSIVGSLVALGFGWIMHLFV